MGGAVTGERFEATRALHALAEALECLERGDCQQAAVRVQSGFVWGSLPILGAHVEAHHYWNDVYLDLRAGRVTPAQLRKTLHQVQEYAWAL